MFNKIFFTALTIILSISLASAEKGSLKIGVMPAPPDISASVKFTEPSGNNMLDAYETGILTVIVNNSGKGDAFDVTAEIKTDKNIKGLSFNNVISFGTIPAGKSFNKEIELKAGENLPADNLSFTIMVKEANGFDADPLRVAFRTKALEPPKLIVADVGIEDQNGNSTVEQMEIVELTARIQNIGYGDARNVSADVVNGANVFIVGDGKTHFEIGNLQPGKFRDIKFTFYTNKRIGNGEKIPVEIKINEARQRFNIAKALDLKMNARQRSMKELVVEGTETEKGEIRIATGLSVDIEQDLPVTKTQNKDAFAVVIGNSDYRHAKAVDFAVNDAQMVKRYLTDVIGFREGNVFFLSNATKGDLELFFGTKDNYKGKLFNQIKPDKSDVFIYYAGHGAPGLKDRKGYFVPVEADPQYIELSGYPLDVFYGNLSKMPVRSVTVVMDSCFSGADIYESISPIVLEIDNPVINLKNGVVLSSSTGAQVSSWYNEKRHGMFTYFFLKAIHDKNADYDKNNELTFEEIYKYISDEAEGVPYYARSIHNVEQTPVVQGRYQGRVLVKY